MLDVPIWYRGRTIGVICIENLSPRVWKKEEVNFSRILSSYYSFAFSVSETNSLVEKVKISETKLNNRMTAINRSNAVIELNIDGMIKYANDNFLDLMGYTHEDIAGKHHRIFVPEEDRDTEEYKEFWKHSEGVNTLQVILLELRRTEVPSTCKLHTTRFSILMGKSTL
jgi:hypothetical protein